MLYSLQRRYRVFFWIWYFSKNLIRGVIEDGLLPSIAAFLVVGRIVEHLFNVGFAYDGTPTKLQRPNDTGSHVSVDGGTTGKYLKG